jgi:hypothetical protein
VKVAVAALAWSMVTVQVLVVPVQAPDQPSKVDRPGALAAVSTTSVPGA